MGFHEMLLNQCIDTTSWFITGIKYGILPLEKIGCMKRIIRYRLVESGILSLLVAGGIALQFRDVGDWIFNDAFNKRDGSIYWSLSIGYLFSGLLFFLNIYWLIPKHLSNGQYKKYLIGIILLFGLCSGLEELVDAGLRQIFSLPANLNNLYDFTISHNIRNAGGPTILINLIVLTVSFLYRFSKDWWINERTKQKLMQEMLTAELQFLKTQINPHLLFNTLNALFSMARKQKDYEVSDAIMKLSEIMRYMLYESNVPEVSLETEVRLLRNFVELQQLRTEAGEFVVQFDIEGDLSGIPIAPLLLIPFVENAFKYGFDMRGGSVVLIRIRVSHGKLQFICRNKVIHNPGELLDTGTGIGLTNVRRRLALLYPEKHDLSALQKGEYFEVNLTVKLLS